jgi:hypothetical protein
MSKPIRQFVIGLVITLSLASIIGVGAYVVAHGQDSRSPGVKPAVVTQSSPTIEFGNGSQVQVDVAPRQTPPASVEPNSGAEMEIETDCARRKRQQQGEKRQAGQRPKTEGQSPGL